MLGTPEGRLAKPLPAEELLSRHSCPRHEGPAGPPGTSHLASEVCTEQSHRRPPQHHHSSQYLAIFVLSDLNNCLSLSGGQKHLQNRYLLQFLSLLEHTAHVCIQHVPRNASRAIEIPGCSEVNTQFLCKPYRRHRALISHIPSSTLPAGCTGAFLVWFVGFFKGHSQEACRTCVLQC